MKHANGKASCREYQDEDDGDAFGQQYLTTHGNKATNGEDGDECDHLGYSKATLRHLPSIT